MAYTDKTVDSWTHSPATGATVPAGTTSPKVGWNGNLEQIKEWWTWIRGAFHGTTGHTHTGAQGDGTPIAIGGVADGASAVSMARGTAIVFQTNLESIDAATTSFSGTGSVSLNATNGYASISTGTTSGSDASLYYVKSYPASATGWTWAKNRTLVVGFNITDVTNVDAYLGTGLFGFQIIGIHITASTVIAYSSDGTASTGTPIAIANGTHTLRVEFISGTSVQMYVDGVSIGTITTHLPAGTLQANYPLFSQIVSSAAVNKSLRLGEVWCIQHP